MASGGVPSLLALEIEASLGKTKGRVGGPAADPRDEPRQSTVGSTTDSWRTAQARHRYRADKRGQIHGPEATPTVAGLGTFLRNHADGIAATDLFVVPTISFRLLCGLLLLRHDRRRLLWLGATSHPTADWIARQLVEACGRDRAHAISSKTAIAAMARCSFGVFAPWAFEIDRPHPDRPGRTDMRNG